ncbi:hypothetical protein QBC39DRAFT_143334 [Podospora conica]|nr:hypothetical protein QBC39DRAFT_143334 [Schizothecium conicum]
MQFSIATLVSVLAVAEVASAWQSMSNSPPDPKHPQSPRPPTNPRTVIGYRDTPSCDSRFTNRVLRGSGSSGCMTFGQNMPGVGCTHYGGEGHPAQGCSGHLPISSIRVGTGENCWFYRNPGCTGAQIWYRGVNNCASFGSRTEIGSYKCSNA